MKNFKTFLTEASTSDATNAEMTIVVAYNRMKNKKLSEDDAVKLGKINDKKWKALRRSKKFNKLYKTGEAVAKDPKMKGSGTHLVHAGSATAPTKYPKPASDKTSKADLYGTITGTGYSLKKTGEKGGGAQLMSAKSGEAAGVFKFAKLHYENNDKSTALKGYKAALDILREDMEATATNEMYVYVGEGKKDFQTFWKSKKNPRFALLYSALTGMEIDTNGYIKDKNGVYGYDARVAAFKANSKKPPKLKDIDLSDKDGSHITNHLDAEISMLGARTTTMGDPAKKLIKSSNSKYENESFIKLASDADLKIAQDIFKSDTEIKIGDDTKISADHLKKVPEDNLSNAALKKQIIDIVDVSIKAKGWQESLTNFFDTNEKFKQWVIYEAASGEGKFTGKAAGSGSYTGKENSVANSMLVFTDTGVNKKEDIYKWSAANTSLMGSLSISYKGSGSSRYIKMGISSGVEYENPSMITEEISNTLESIIDIELINYRGAMYQLNEGFLDTVKGIYTSVKDTAKLIADKAKEILKKFYMAVIKKFMDKVFEWVSNGIDYLLEILGLKMVGDVSIATPSW